MPMKYYREYEQKKQELKQQRAQQKYIESKEAAMMKSITQIQCRMLRHCQNKDTYCMACSKNTHRNQEYPPVDYFKPKVAGMRVLP
jgi:hypothetical protein